MKKLLSIIALILLLTGCQSEPKGEFVDVIVKDKRIEEECAKGCWDNYYVILEKDGTQVELLVKSEGVFSLLTKGNVVSVVYDSHYRIMDVKIPTLESKKD